ncbi:MAG: hypothetical protein D4R96_02890 [Nitrosopumilaceae archaeon]|nr:MAG: hypothetical protein D4R96_02890 [Nitrosopumilaceae archaeon]
MENTGDNTIYVSKNNFQIIDVNVDAIGVYSLASSPQDPKDINDFAEINQVLSNQKIGDANQEGMTKIPKVRILKRK